MRLCPKILMEFQFSLSQSGQGIWTLYRVQGELCLVIADLRMPGLNGLELLKKVKTSNPKVRTILMSAYNFEEDILFLKYMEEGIINSTIDKPVTMNRLYQAVKDQLDVN